MSKKSKIHREYELEYEKILKDFESILGNDTTYNTDLERIGYKELGSGFAGVFSSDRIPRLNEIKKYAILNLDHSKQPGSHWVAIAYDEKNDDIIFYDSFGRHSKRIIPSLHSLYEDKDILNTENDAEQHSKENNCGQRSLAFLLFFKKYGPEKSLLI